jgi:parallel beta-helix repeat protein
MILTVRKRALLVGLTFSALVLVAAALQAGQMEPPGPPGETMKPLSDIEPRRGIWREMLPLVITEHGTSWYLLESIGVGGYEDGITIDANSVTIDLNGFTLSGSNTGIADGIKVNAGRQDAKILNGTIREWGGDGIDAEAASHCRMTGLTLRNNAAYGVNAGSSAIVSECIVTSSWLSGIVAGEGSVVRDCTVEGGNDGFTLEGSSVSNCIARDNIGNGFVLGIGNSVVRCQAISNDGNGIRMDFANTVSDNVVKGNGEDGIVAIAGNYIFRNLVDLNGAIFDASGILVTAWGNRIEGNNVTSNDRGIDIDGAGNVIIKNSAKGNTPNYDIVAGNDVGPIGTAATSTSPWANIAY